MLIFNIKHAYVHIYLINALNFAHFSFSFPIKIITMEYTTKINTIVMISQSIIIIRSDPIYLSASHPKLTVIYVIKIKNDNAIFFFSVLFIVYPPFHILYAIILFSIFLSLDMRVNHCF